MKKEDFIAKSKDVHGDEYVYDLLPDEWHSSEKVTLICKRHGEFKITNSNHIHNGYGCYQCNKESLLKHLSEQFIKKSMKLFGDTLDYSRLVYTSARDKVELVCKKHSKSFFITPDSHVSKSRYGGCPDCLREVRQLSTTNSDNFFKRAVNLHGDKYDYSEVDYQNAKTKVIIRCIKHDYKFETTPDSHCRAPSGGCRICHSEVSGQYHRLTVSKFIEKARQKHGDRYDYSGIEQFKNAHEKVKIGCKLHGTFDQTVSNHIYNGFGCPTCANIESGLKIRLTLEECIGKFEKQHGDRFDYSLVDYQGLYSPVKIFCKEHSVWFEQQPANHFTGVGCKECIDKGYSRQKAGYLYINKVNEDVVKVGITNVSAQERLKTLNRKSEYNIINLYCFYHEDGDFIFRLEKEILSKFPTGVVDKTKMRSGFTETISSEYLPEIIDTIVYAYSNYS